MVQEIVINDNNAHLFSDPDYFGRSRGLRPRNYGSHPVGYLGEMARPFNMPIIPTGERQARLDALIAAKAQLSNRRMKGNNGQPIPSRDQNGKGYCWAHSSVSAMLAARAMMGEPYADLSAYAVACIIKGYRDEGGWGAESLEFIAERGVPTAQFWPQQSMSRTNDNTNTWANAALHKYTDWMDGTPRSVDQLVTCLLNNIPVVCDFNWWSHSVCALDLVSLSPLRIRIWNSWGDSWSDNGMGILEGNKAIPDGMVMPTVALASAA